MNTESENSFEGLVSLISSDRWDRINKDGKVFKSIRGILKLRNEEFAELFDINITTLSRWETGKIKINKTAWYTLLSIARDKLLSQNDDEINLFKNIK